MLGLQAGSGVLDQAEEELVRRCMAAQGFRYVKAPADQGPATIENAYGISIGEARRHGYRTPRTSAAEPEEKPEVPAWWLALSGRPEAPLITVEVPEIGTVQATSEGCRAQARSTLYGDPPERWLFYMFFSDNFKHRVRVRAATDPRLAVLNQRWSSCMSGRGYPELRDPAQARALAADYYEQDDRNARRKEIALATADATCEQTLTYAPRRRALEDRYFTAGMRIYEAEAAAVRETGRQALRRARHILAATGPEEGSEWAARGA
ncbi:hypothetical protein Aph01nite_10340 [Acrocarpospora phusangensis]|uniref:Uncharacterized protein n=1 Tax=Acrocarpospora phusangensis TaxID=1070424 RepID=A0A919Q5G8_9ACTN|nr:hypothetical protein Aph01nite_10340 [Acrocarpospora phusangensis]